MFISYSEDHEQSNVQAVLGGAGVAARNCGNLLKTKRLAEDIAVPGKYFLRLTAADFPNLKAFRLVIPGSTGDGRTRPAASVTIKTFKRQVTDVFQKDTGVVTPGSTNITELGEASALWEASCDKLYVTIVPAAKSDVSSKLTPVELTGISGRSETSTELRMKHSEVYAELTIEMEANSKAPYVTGIPETRKEIVAPGCSTAPAQSCGC